MGDVFGTLAMCLIAVLPFALLFLALLGPQFPDRASKAPVDYWWKASRPRTRRPAKSLLASYQLKVPAGSLPTAVVSLAEAFAAGEDCGFALHDALLEANRPDLAEQFTLPGLDRQRATVERILHID